VTSFDSLAIGNVFPWFFPYLFFSEREER